MKGNTLLSESGLIKTDRNLVVGIGSALVDILVHENDAFLKKTCVPKGGMTLVDNEYIEQTLSATNSSPHIVPGGSACNTTIGIARLGGAARFVGKCGKDDLGNFFETELKKNNVEPALFKADRPTGRVLSVITPDAQRSMLTFLGASAETHPHELGPNLFKNAAIVHIEGYLLFNKDLMLSALTAAKNAGAAVSLDLASFTVVRESKKFLDVIIPEFVDILIANEDEAFAYSDSTNERDALKALSENTEIAVLKVGHRGSFVFYAGKVITNAPCGNGSAVDTTGAGDLWASGFLYGLVHNFSLEKSGLLGSACGHEVCQVVGASIPEAGWKRVKKSFEPHF